MNKVKRLQIILRLKHLLAFLLYTLDPVETPCSQGMAQLLIFPERGRSKRKIGKAA